MPFISPIQASPVLIPQEDLVTTYSLEEELLAIGFLPAAVFVYFLFIPAGRLMSSVYGRGFNSNAVGFVLVGVGAKVTGPGGVGLSGSAIRSIPITAGLSGGAGGGAGRPPGIGGLGITRSLGTSAPGSDGTATLGGAPGAGVDGQVAFSEQFVPLDIEESNGGHAFDVDHVIHLELNGIFEGGGGGGNSRQFEIPENTSFAGGNLAEAGGQGISGSRFYGRAGKALILNISSTISGSGSLVGAVQFEG